MEIGEEYGSILGRHERAQDLKQMMACRMIDEERPLSVFGSQFTSGEFAYPFIRQAAEPLMGAQDFESQFNALTLDFSPEQANDRTLS